MSNPRTFVAAALCGAAIAGGAQAATNLVTNGNFSAPASGAYAILANGSVPGWTNVAATDPNVEIGNSGTYGLTCYNTTCTNLEVNANTFGTVQQTITGLKIGQAYTFSYAYGGRDGGGSQEMTVTLGGKTIDTEFSDGITHVWTPFSTTIFATSTSETLSFNGLNVGGSPSYGDEVTAVSLTAVPEPATWAMMLIGFGGLGAALRMNRRRTLVAA